MERTRIGPRQLMSKQSRPDDRAMPPRRLSTLGAERADLRPSTRHASAYPVLARRPGLARRCRGRRAGRSAGPPRPPCRRGVSSGAGMTGRSSGTTRPAAWGTLADTRRSADSQSYARVGVRGVRQRADEVEARHAFGIAIGYDRDDGEERVELGEIVAHILISCA
jgi:hypothetical protein